MAWDYLIHIKYSHHYTWLVASPENSHINFLSNKKHYHHAFEMVNNLTQDIAFYDCQNIKAYHAYPSLVSKRWHFYYTHPKITVLVLYTPIIKYNIFSLISTLGGKTEKEYDRLKPAPFQHRCDSPVVKNPAWWSAGQGFDSALFLCF